MPWYRINYGNSIIDGGLFLRRQTPLSVIPQYEDGAGGSFRHLSTFSDKSTIKESLIGLLDSARRYVFFTSFLIQDNQVIQGLIEAARRLKGHVYVLTTLKDSDFGALLEEQADEDQWNFKEHIECVRQLARNGISVKARKDCHAKFAVIDDQCAIVTSANAVPTCFMDIPQKNGSLREANPENGVLIQMDSEVKRLSNFFRAIWRSAYNYELPPDAQISDIIEFSKEIMHITSREPASMSDEGQIIWTAPGDCRILNSIARMIDAARQKITICTYVIKGIEKHPLGRKLLAAAQRGVKIEILVRGMYRRDHLNSCYFLKKSMGEQVNIYGDFCNHAKAVLVDDQEAMTLTANLDSQHGLDSSVEMGFVSKQPEFVRFVMNFLDRLRAGCRLEFIANPTQKYAAECFSTLSKPILAGNIVLDIQQRWKDRNRIINKMLSEMNKQLIRVSNFEDEQSHKVRLLTNNLIATCVHLGDNRLNILHIIETETAANMRFQQILPPMRIEINVS